MSEGSRALASLSGVLDAPLWVVTAAHGGARGGLIATSVIKASTVPEAPRMLISISRTHRTWELIDASRSFALQPVPRTRIDWVERFGTISAREVDKFAGLAVESTAEGPPRLVEAPALLVCRVEAAFDAGDRSLFLGEVVAGSPLAPDSGFEPLTVGACWSMLRPEALDRFRARLEAETPGAYEAILQWRARHVSTTDSSRNRS
ncbi:MAG: flavin reductase family protein [Isosphaeraceae bacterium]|nr:flavin reductase family protein [Isosphaeraceae bacterium]